MEYSIGEVSSLLNLSRDMIRYYEKQGAIKASRNTNNNYRSYDSMEVFWLLEAMEHKSWGIPINEIADIRTHAYTYHTERFLNEKISSLRKEASYNEMLAGRLEEIRKYMLLGMKNIGNFWVDFIPAEYRCHLVTARDDVYDRINLSEQASRYVFCEENLPFFDSGIAVENDHVEWEMVIRKEYADALEEKPPEDFSYLPASLCICTHVDIGEIGQFDMSTLHVLEEYAKQRGYSAAGGGRIRGILLGRGYEENRFHRILRLCMPVS